MSVDSDWGFSMEVDGCGLAEEMTMGIHDLSIDGSSSSIDEVMITPQNYSSLADLLLTVDDVTATMGWLSLGAVLV
jgi:hypothetical protein